MTRCTIYSLNHPKGEKKPWFFERVNFDKRVHSLTLPNGKRRRLKIRDDLREKVSAAISKVHAHPRKGRKQIFCGKFRNETVFYKHIEKKSLAAYRADSSIDLQARFNQDVEAYICRETLDAYFV